MKLERKSKRKSRLDITPLIDVVFLLLIFFMLTFSVQGQGIEINLPGKSSGAKTPPQLPLILKIHKDGSLELENKNLGYDSLTQVLENKLELRKEKNLVVDIHKTVEYDVFVRVLDLAKKAGTENFSIIR